MEEMSSFGVNEEKGREGGDMADGEERR
ncbi:hypothetical protein A2U01_0079745, partial [Trifolium medium]|nr:hypothetical protein [Trifolium medium]